MSVNIVSHPARFTPLVLDIIGALLPERGLVLDPFAGVGGIHSLATPDRRTVGIELEPEWAHAHPNTFVGDATDLPFPDHAFDAIATSPVYGNRLSDHHNAQDGSLRRSYTHDLGRTLTPGNAGVLYWGDEYRALHERAWVEADRVLKPGGKFLLNISDHIRRGERQHVSEWHAGVLTALGLTLIERIDIATPRMRYGANAAARVEAEHVYHFEKGQP